MCLHVKVSFLGVKMNVMHLSIPLFRETLRRHLENSTRIQRLGNTNFIKNFTLHDRMRTSCNNQQKFFRGWKNWVDWSSSKQGVISNPADPFYVTIYLNQVLFISNIRFSNHSILWNKMESSCNVV